MNSVSVVYCQDAAFLLSASEMASKPAQGSSSMDGVQYSSAGMSEDLDCGHKPASKSKKKVKTNFKLSAVNDT